MNNIPQAILKSGKDESAKRFHPWIFSGAIKKIEGNVAEGDLIRVVNNKNEYLGTGHYQVGSIAIRLLTFKDEEVDVEFWRRRIMTAYDLRKKLGLAGTPDNNTYRLVYAEGDNLPGLIIDYYNGTVITQAHSIGMFKNRHTIVEILKEMYGDELKAVYDKSEKTLPFKADVEPVNEYLFGKSAESFAVEMGLKFHIDWKKGQKTGFFIDQRENRILLEKYAKDKNVLNMFGYTGGFSVYALRGGARLVHTVDSSARAIDLSNTNVELNFGEDPRHKGISEDAFTFFDQMDTEYDLVILDPPAFAKHRNVIGNALQGYKRLNVRAMERMPAGGILFTFSCSQVVSRDSFRKAVFSAAAIAGRNVKILHQLSQPADHPINIYHPEGEYLKGLVLEVTD